MRTFSGIAALSHLAATLVHIDAMAPRANRSLSQDLKLRSTTPPGRKQGGAGGPLASYSETEGPPTLHAEIASSSRKLTQYGSHEGWTSRGEILGPVIGSVLGLYGALRSRMPACSGVRLALRLLHG